MFKNALLILSSLLATVVIPATAACTNGACTKANAIYNRCQFSTVSVAAFKTCLCTPIFLENYRRCIGGVVCPWDGDPSTLIGPCNTLYCPGTVAGGFDAAAFCADGTAALTLEARADSAKPSSTKKKTTTTTPLPWTTNFNNHPHSTDTITEPTPAPAPLLAERDIKPKSTKTTVIWTTSQAFILTGSGIAVPTFTLVPVTFIVPVFDESSSETLIRTPIAGGTRTLVLPTRPANFTFLVDPTPTPL
ncbi:hypothetical protein FRB91_002528 [Serendipita sp. 411]|nr:hypothetical protein FRB91_002528 [Serendipita sp. 411]